MRRTTNDTLFQSVLHNLQNTYPSNNSNHFRYTGGRNNQTILDIISTYNHNISMYNENMRRYQDNLLELIRYIQRSENNNESFPAASASSTANPFQRRTYSTTRSPLFTTAAALDIGLGNRIFDFFQNVTVSPTTRQIENATTHFLYNSMNINQTQCPITLENFEENEELCRINHCGHTFKKTAILNWFQQNVRCPVCRYDIRTNNPPTSNSSTNEESIEPSLSDSSNNDITNDVENDVEEESVIDDNQEQTTNDIFNTDDISNLTNALVNTLGRHLNSNLENFIQSHYDVSNNMLTLDFPVIYYTTQNQNSRR